MDCWRVAQSCDDIIISFAGHDKQRAWPRAIAEFEALMASRSQAPRVLIDLRQMSGYETQARRAWQEAFRRHRQRLVGVICVGGTRRIRMGLAVVGAVAGVPMRFVDEWPQVEPP